MTRSRIHALWTVVAVIGLVAACSGVEVRQPAAMDDGWETVEASSVGIDQDVLSDLIQHVSSTPSRAVHSILIVKDGKLAFEEYFEGHRFDYAEPEFEGEPVVYDADTTHNLMSVTKAVTAALVGIAIDHGAISNVRESVIDALPAYEDLRTSDNEQVTIEHLLTMTSGFDWNEWDMPLTSRDNDLIQLFIVDDPIAYILQQPITHEPGTWWYYSGGDVNLLGEVIEAHVGEPVDEFAARELFAPLGISDYAWQYLNPDVVYASGELALKPRDLAKFGYLYLNHGEWNGDQILASEWVAASIATHISTRGLAADGEGYGYQWFTTTYHHKGESVKAIQRTGWGGQAVVLIPALETMIVLTGGDYTLQTRFDNLITNYILPSLP